MRVRILWTAHAVDHILRHDLTPGDVETAVGGHTYSRKTGPRYLIIGRTADKVLFVVVEPSRSSKGFFEVATARRARLIEKRLLRREGR